MEVHEIRRVFGNGLHNAFTSIAWFRGAPYVAFRCGTNHVSADGRVLVLRGDVSGRSWLPVAVVWAGIDTRDPKLMAMDEGLFVYCFSRCTEPDRIVSGYAFSADGNTWEPWTPVAEGWVYWRPEWLGEQAVVAAYGRPPQCGTRKERGPVVLMRSEDGRTWQQVTTLVEVSEEGRYSEANEAALTLGPDGRLWALVRRETQSKQPLLCWAEPPFREWQWAELPIKLQGPYLWFAGETLYISGRWYQPSGMVNTAVFRMEGEEPVPQLVLPSGGDTSYMGAVLAEPGNEKRWWLIYYSSHESLRRCGDDQPAAIYLADVTFD